METKKVNWSKCLAPGSSISEHDPKKLQSWNIKIERGTHISGKYGESDIHMEITEVLTDGTFLAKIKYFEPINVTKPTDLEEGDCVPIDMEHICWIHGK